MKNENIQIDQSIARNIWETVAKIVSEREGVKITIVDIKVALS